MDQIIKNKNVFITGTDTGVGKSIFTSFLALLYAKEGKKVAISKPIQTGKEKDTDFLTKLTGNKIPIFNTYSFSLAAAPVISAKEENKNIDYKSIISDIKKIEKEFDHVIVEGIGGIAVPIVGNGRDHSLQVADLIKYLNYPVIIVARPTLGTINHTVLTIEYAKQKGLNILGFVISGYDERANDPAIKTAPEEISKISGVSCLLKLPVIRKLNYQTIEETVVSFSSNTPSCLANV